MRRLYSILMTLSDEMIMVDMWYIFPRDTGPIAWVVLVNKPESHSIRIRMLSPKWGCGKIFFVLCESTLRWVMPSTFPSVTYSNLAQTLLFADAWGC